MECKLALEEKKNAKQALERQWKLDIDTYTNELDVWCEEEDTLEAAWREQRDQARMAHQRPRRSASCPFDPKDLLNQRVGT